MIRALIYITAGVAVSVTVGVAVGRWLDTEDDDEIFARLIRGGAWA